MYFYGSETRRACVSRASLQSRRVSESHVQRAGQADDLSQRLHFPALFFASKCSFPALTRNHRAKVGLSPRAVQHMQSLQRRAKHRRSITRHSTASKARLASGIIAYQRHHGMRTRDSWAASTGTVQSAMRSLQQQNSHFVPDSY